MIRNVLGYVVVLALVAACGHRNRDANDATRVVVSRTDDRASSTTTTGAASPAAASTAPARRSDTIGVVPPVGTPNAPAAAASDPSASAREKDTDRTIASKIRQQIVADQAMAPVMQNVQVVSKDGHVLLRGQVANDGDRALIEAKARAVEGVVSVENKIDVVR